MRRSGPICPCQGKRSVKPSAQPTLVRTQHLPPPAKTARWLRKRGLAGRFLLVPPCVIVCRCRSWRSDRYGHIDGQRPGRRSGPWNRLLCRSAPVLSRYTGARTARLTGACHAILGGRFSAVLLQLGAGLVLFVPAAGEGCRIGPRHPVEAATEAVTECASPAAGWKTGTVRGERCYVRGLDAARAAASRRMRVPGVPLRDWIWLSQSCTCRGLVMHLSCTRRIPALVTRRITRPPDPLAAAERGARRAEVDLV